MIKITKQEYEQDILKSGFKPKFPVQHSGKGNKYYYLVDVDYDNYQKYMANRKRSPHKVIESF